MKIYGAETTTDEVLEGVNLQGRHFTVTGASSGLGAISTARGNTLRAPWRAQSTCARYRGSWIRLPGAGLF